MVLLAELHSTSDTKLTLTHSHTHTAAGMELNPLGGSGGCTAATAVERSREVLAVLQDDESDEVSADEEVEKVKYQ